MTRVQQERIRAEKLLKEHVKKVAKLKGITSSELKELTPNDVLTYSVEELKIMAKKRKKRVGRPRKKAAAKTTTHTKKRRGRPRKAATAAPKRRKKYAKRTARGGICISPETAIRLRNVGIKL